MVLLPRSLPLSRQKRGVESPGGKKPHIWRVTHLALDADDVAAADALLHFHDELLLLLLQLPQPQLHAMDLLFHRRHDVAADVGVQSLLQAGLGYKGCGSGRKGKVRVSLG